MKLIRVDELFTVTYGSGYSLQDLQKGNIPFVARGARNNGISSYVCKTDDNPFDGNCITVAVSGSVMESFYQENPFYTSYHILILMPKKKLTKEQMLYYCMCLRGNKYRYNYGRQANKTLKEIRIPHPNNLPNYIKKEISKKPSNKAFLQNTSIDLKIEKYQYFKLDKLFNITGSKSFSKRQIQELGKGKYPYIVTSSENNGVQGFYNHYTEKGNVLTIDSATIGSCFYQLVNFSASDHVEKLVPKFDMNIYLALFLKTIISLEQFRYGYGRKFAQMRIKNTKIKLPVDSNGNPDWQFMEDYIKSLPYSSNLL